jgi:hypothetical protein
MRVQSVSSVTKKHVQRVKSKMKKLGFEDRFDAFKLWAKTSWNSKTKDDHNKLNREDTAIRKEVESKLRKSCMGGVPWSPPLQLFCDTIELWATLVRRKKQVRASVKRIQCFFIRAGHVPSVILNQAHSKKLI